MKVIARIRRLLLKNRDLRKRFSICIDELKEAEFNLVEFIQRDAFPHEMQLIRSGQNVKPTSSLIRLSPYVDDHGIMRVGGRLGHCDLPVSSKPRLSYQKSILNLL